MTGSRMRKNPKLRTYQKVSCGWYMRNGSRFATRSGTARASVRPGTGRGAWFPSRGKHSNQPRRHWPSRTRNSKARCTLGETVRLKEPFIFEREDDSVVGGQIQNEAGPGSRIDRGKLDAV